MLKYVRIAVTALSLMACLVLVALWVRSYWARDSISRINSERMMTIIGSCTGQVYVTHFDAGVEYKNTNTSSTPRDWTLASRPALPTRRLFMWSRTPTRLIVGLPHWFFAIVAVLISVAIRKPWQFSLRTMLIATTLIGAALGTFVAERL